MDDPPHWFSVLIGYGNPPEYRHLPLTDLGAPPDFERGCEIIRQANGCPPHNGSYGRGRMQHHRHNNNAQNSWTIAKKQSLSSPKKFTYDKSRFSCEK